MVRTQIRLPEDQYEQLKRLAAEEDVSVAELLRRGAELLLRSRRRPPTREQWERARAVMGKYDSGLTDVAERHDHYLAEAYGQWEDRSESS